MKTTFVVRAAAVAALSLSTALSLGAQETDKSKAVERALAGFNATSSLAGGSPNVIRPITVGGRQSSSLDASDLTLEDGSSVEVWAIDLTAGQSVSVTLRSRAFDTVLLVMQGDTPTNRAMNDDFEEGSTDSRLVFRAPSTGSYLLVANSLGRAQYGAYTIEVASVGGNSGGASAGSAGGAVGDMMSSGSNAITMGQTVNGALSTSDPKLTDDSHYDEYTFEGNAGDRVVITMRSGGFDTFLRVVDAAGNEVGSNDDAFEGSTDSQVVVTLSARGRFTIVANSLEAGQTGSYTLTLERGR